MEKRYRSLLLQNFKTIERSNFYDSIFSPIVQLMKTIVIALIVLLSVPEVNFLGISIGMVAAAIELFTNLFSPIENIGMELQEIQQAFSGIRRVNEFYDEPEEEVKSSELEAEEIINDREEVRISFKGVTFCYEENQDILKGIDIEILPMEKVTLTGRTGAGKSTIFKLLMGFLTPIEGTITINGFDVTKIPNKLKRRIIGYVEQDFHFIKGSLREQITLNDEMITEADVLRSISLTGFIEYVQELPEGLDTIMTDSTSFSSGQIQLLSISRALAANPPILLLDEITANLDSITEEKILNVLAKASEKHTILSVSHRLSTMLSSDRIVILEHGKIRNEGTPEKLLREDEWMKSKMILESLTWNKN
jgi:ATP-binding cassette subfamily B protein